MEIFRAFGSLLLKGQDEVTRGLDKVNKRAKRAQSGLQDFGDRVANVGDGLNKLSAGLGAAGGALGLFLGQMGGVGRQIQNQAQQIGVTNQELQEMQAVMRETGLQTEDTTDALISLRDRAEDAAAGAAGATEDFGLLGIEAEQLKDKTPIETFNLVADAAQRMGESLPTAAVRLFGDDIGRQLIPVLRRGSEGINEIRGEATTLSDDFVSSSAQFSKSLGRVGQDFIKLGSIIAEDLLPILNQSLIPAWENRVFPALRRVANAVGDLVAGFRQLPPFVQQTVGVFLILATVLGPILSIGGRLIALFGRFIPLMTAFNPIVLAITVAVTALIAVLANWQTIVKTLGVTFETVSTAITEAWQAIRERTVQDVQFIQQLISQMVNKIIGWFNNLRDQVVNIVGDLFDQTIGKIQRLADEIVGNSIIPDMVAGVGSEFEKMRAKGGSEADRMAKDVMKAVDGVDPQINMGVRGGRAGRGQGAAGGGQNVNVDLRGSIIRDGRDMSDRLVRNGVGLTGAF